MKFQKQQIPFVSISKEVEINYEDLSQISYADKIISNFNSIDTLPEISLVWKADLPKEKQLAQEAKLRKWLTYKLKLDTLVVVSKPAIKAL